MPQPRSGRSLEDASEISAQLQPVYQKLHRDLEAMVQKEVARVATDTEADIRAALAHTLRRGPGAALIPWPQRGAAPPAVRAGGGDDRDRTRDLDAAGVALAPKRCDSGSTREEWSGDNGSRG